MRKFGDAALPLTEPLMQARYAAFLTPACRNQEDKRIAICLLDEMLEHSAAARAKYMDQVVPMLQAACSSPNADVRQCSVYGLGVLAARSPEGFGKHVAGTLKVIGEIVRHAEAK